MAARLRRPLVRDETYVKVAGRWIYLYRAVDQFGQVIDVLAFQKRDMATTRRFFIRAIEHTLRPAEVTTDRAPAYRGCWMSCYPQRTTLSLIHI